MSKTSVAQPKGRSPRRWTRDLGLTHLAAQLPPDFRCPTHVNAFIYSLVAELTAGRVKRRTAAVLGYLSQLALQTLPLLRAEHALDRDNNAPFQFFTHIPPPGYRNSTAEHAPQDDSK